MAGAVLGNLNSTKHGGQIARLKIGSLPKSMARHVRAACEYRRSLERLVVEAKGQVDFRDAHTIDEMCQAELHAGICRWILRSKLDRMQPADIARCSEQILKAKVARNKAYDRLRIDKADADVLSALYDIHPDEPDPAISDSSPSAATGDDQTTDGPCSGDEPGNNE